MRTVAAEVPIKPSAEWRAISDAILQQVDGVSFDDLVTQAFDATLHYTGHSS
ncbi:MAG: hypothetical protein M3Q45_04365 [Chloroflexota bacterium]|nr:hypothetical protein [Chloroflexota bacterium]